MERIVHKSLGFEAAAEWDVQQQVAMSVAERLAAADELRRRAFPHADKDVREWHRSA